MTIPDSGTIEPATSITPKRHGVDVVYAKTRSDIDVFVGFGGKAFLALAFEVRVGVDIDAGTAATIGANFAGEERVGC